MEKLNNCLDCSHHDKIRDSDPYDSFCSDDIAVVCTKTINDRLNPDSIYAADRSSFKAITVSCRPYNDQKESHTPKWCPLTSTNGGE